MSTDQKVVLQYSTAFKLKVVEQIERGELTIAQARRVYDIRGGQTIQKWLAKHGKSHLLSGVVRVQMKDEKDRILPFPSAETHCVVLKNLHF